MQYGFKALSKLQQKKFRQEYGLFLVEGKKGVEDALAAGADVVQLVATDQFLRQAGQFMYQASVKPFFSRNTVLTLSQAEFSQLADTTTPQGIMAVVKQQQTTVEQVLQARRLVLFEDIRDPGNLGTMLRTADWFGIEGVLLVGGADPYQPKVVRSSMGSFFHLPICQVPLGEGDALADQLKSAGFMIVVTRPEADSHTVSLKAEQKLCVVFGNESRGTSSLIDEVADQSFSIPQFGRAESLNVAVSVGVTLYALLNQTSQRDQLKGVQSAVQ